MGATLHRPEKSFGRGMPKLQTQLNRGKRMRLSLSDSSSDAGGSKTAARKGTFRLRDALK